MKVERKKAKRILFDTLKDEGWEEVLFPTCSIKDNNAIIETVIDAMIKFKTSDKNKK